MEWNCTQWEKIRVGDNRDLEKGDHAHEIMHRRPLWERIWRVETVLGKGGYGKERPLY